VIKIFLSILLALGLGFAVAGLFWPRQRRLLPDLPLVLSLSVGLGFGITSLLFFLWLLIFGPAGTAFALCESGLLIALSVLVVLKRRRLQADSVVPAALLPSARRPLVQWITGVIFVVTLLAAGGGFLWFARAARYGGWDAWGIWNLRAKFLFLGGPFWQDAFSAKGSLSHRDYPLLIPTSVARVWSYAGTDVPLAPILIGALFTAATGGLLLSSLSKLHTKSQGFMATTVLLANSYFLVLGAAQYADLPLGFFFLSTLALLCLYEQTRDPGVMALAGATAGLATWTKNEGVLFLAGLLLSHCLITVRKNGVQAYLRQLLPFALGLAPALLALAYFKIHFPSSNDLFPSLAIALKMLGRISRWRVVAKAFAHELLHFGGPPVPVIPLLAIYAGVAGIQWKQLGNLPKVCLLLLLWMIAGYFLVYVATPLPLDWLLETSLSRLLTQLWPSTLFLIFLFTRPLEPEPD
jgi:hypothetical protein